MCKSVKKEARDMGTITATAATILFQIVFPELTLRYVCLKLMAAATLGALVAWRTELVLAPRPWVSPYPRERPKRSRWPERISFAVATIGAACILEPWGANLNLPATLARIAGSVAAGVVAYRFCRWWQRNWW